SRDSFSEVDGRYLFGDLPPGQYQLRVDPTTLPPGMIAEPAVRTMPVKPGQTTDGADFRIVRPVINRPAPVMTSVPKPKPPAPQAPAVQPAAAPRAANVGNPARPSAPLLQTPDLQLHVSEAPALPQAPLV